MIGFEYLDKNAQEKGIKIVIKKAKIKYLYFRGNKDFEKAL